MMPKDCSKIEELKSNEESLFSIDKTQFTQHVKSFHPISTLMLEKLKDSTKKLICLMEEIQTNTNDDIGRITPSYSEYLEPNVSVEVDTAEIQELAKLEKYTQNIENYLNSEDSDCSVYKKLIRKCTCLNNQLYNDFTIHFNEDTKHFTSRVGEIIKNLRIVKKFLYMGNNYTKNALIFLNEGLLKSSFTQRIEIIQGCTHADMCNVFEDHSIISFCIHGLSKNQEYVESPQQILVTELLNKVARIEEGRRYLTFNSKITNNIRKVLRKGRSKLDACTIESLESTLNLLLPPLQSCSNFYYTNPLNEGLLNKVICALEQRALLTQDELFYYMNLFKNISCFESGRGEVKLNLPKVLTLLKDVLIQYDSSEMNIIVTFILNNIMTKEPLEKEKQALPLTMVADVETEPVNTKNQCCQIPKRKQKKKQRSKSVVLKSDRYLNSSKQRGIAATPVIVLPLNTIY